MNKKLAFTLIELLVVIAVIGILSGLIVVSMSGVTNKASIAKSQVFSNSLRNSLMLNTVTEWKFDVDGTDSWGTNNGTIYGGNIINSGCVNGSCLNLGGAVSNYFIKNPYNDFPVTEFTIEGWVKTSSTAEDGIFSYGTTHSDNEFLFYNPKSIYVYIYAGSVSTGIVINDGNWHHIVSTWNNTNGALRVYIDGTRKYLGSLQTGSTLVSGGCFVIGQDQDTVGGGFTVSQALLGLIDEVRIYKEIVPTSQIKEQYFIGINSLFKNGVIDREDYLSRINKYAKN